MKDFSNLPDSRVRREYTLRQAGKCTLCGKEPLVMKSNGKPHMHLGELCRNKMLSKKKETYRKSKEMLEKGGGA